MIAAAAVRLPLNQTLRVWYSSYEVFSIRSEWFSIYFQQILFRKIV